MDIKDTAAEALEKGKDVAGNVADKAKELGHDALEKAKEAGEKAKELGGDAMHKVKDAVGEATKEGSFLDKLKDKAETMTGIDINRDGKIGDTPVEKKD
ncbi:MAG: hypothetical protein WCI55_02655 [Armatimonadota bacterium]